MIRNINKLNPLNLIKFGGILFFPYCINSLPALSNANNYEPREQLINIERLKDELKCEMNFIIDLLNNYSIFTENYIEELFKNYNNNKSEGVLDMIRHLKEDSLILYMGEMADISALLEMYLLSEQNDRFYQNLLKIYPQFTKIKSLIAQISSDN